MFKKYTAGVFCLELSEENRTHGDIVTVETKYGKQVEAMIWKKLFSKASTGKTYYSYVRTDGFNRTAWLAKKAEQREASAERHNQKSDEYYARSQKDRDFLVLAEPIKVGHHSERHHRKIIQQAHDNMGKCVEASKKAEAFADKAETLAYRAQADINLDDPACLEQLAMKVQRLEAERKALKDSGTYESYQLSNMGANIRRYKERLETARKLWDLEYTPTPAKPNTQKEDINAIIKDTGAIFAFNQKQLDEQKQPGVTYVHVGHGCLVPSERLEEFRTRYKNA